VVFLRLAAKGRITDEELDEELAQLEETRKTAERELAILKHDQEQIEQLERDKDTILRQYAYVTPEALDALVSEERHQFYKMLRLKATAHVDGPIEVELAGDAVSVPGVSGSETTQITGENPIVHLARANLINTDLSEANLRGANLREALLSEADLRGADLIANLSNANLSRADLSGANLSGATVTNGQLDMARKLSGAIMPNGTKYY